MDEGLVIAGIEAAEKAISQVCEDFKASPAFARAVDELREFLFAKNRKYGNAVYNPVRLFSRASVEELIRVRLDDKVTRIRNGSAADEDPFDDFQGYLVLLKALPIYLELAPPALRPPYDYSEPCDDAGCDACGGTLPEQVPMERIAPSHGYAKDDKVIDANGNQGKVTIVGAVGAYILFDNAEPNEDSPAGEYFTAAELDRSFTNISKPGPMTPHSEVHAAVVSRGLRVGMTYQEVRDNKWTQCAWTSSTGFDEITPCGKDEEQCSSCEFLDGAICTCGHSYMLHSESENCIGCDDGCGAFSLASWPKPQDDGITYREEQPMVYAAVDNNSPKETNMVEPKKTRTNRATWHESAIGQGAISRVLLALQDKPVQAWLLCDIVKVSGFLQPDVKLALDHLLSTGAIVQHGKAKGTRYAVAGFTDWPLPTRKKKASKRIADAVADTIEDAADMMADE